MKRKPRAIALLFILLTAFLLLTACEKESHVLEWTVPANDGSTFLYAEEELIASGKTLKITAQAGFSSAAVVLRPVSDEGKNTYDSAVLSHDSPVTFSVEKGARYQLGISVSNDAKGPIAVSVKVSGAALASNP